VGTDKSFSSSYHPVQWETLGVFTEPLAPASPKKKQTEDTTPNIPVTQLFSESESDGENSEDDYVVEAPFKRAKLANVSRDTLSYYVQPTNRTH
jgi:hypothetical protein